MPISHVGSIVADRLNVPVATLERLEEQLQLPTHRRYVVDNATLLIIAALCPRAAGASVVDRFAQLIDVENGEITKAAPFLANMLASLVRLNDETAPYAYGSTVTLHHYQGGELAMVVTVPHNEGREVITFTEDGEEFQPSRLEGMGIARAIGGKTLFHIAQDIADFVLTPAVATGEGAQC